MAFSRKDPFVFRQQNLQAGVASAVKRAGLLAVLFGSPLVAGFSPSQTPLFLTPGATPNVMLMLDDSGSMDWEILMKPHYIYCAYMSRLYFCSQAGSLVDNGRVRIDGYGSTNFSYLHTTSDNAYSLSSSNGRSLELVWNINSVNDLFTTGDWRVFSSDVNVMYFDPAREYEPWGKDQPDAVFTAARSHPVSSEAGYALTRDLTGALYAVAVDDKGFSGTLPYPTASSYQEASNGLIDAWDSLTLYQINDKAINVWSVSFSVVGADVKPTLTQQPSITDLAEVLRIQQNYANWYQYHRRRSFVVNSAVSTLMEQSPHYRYALGLINGGWLGRSPAGDLDEHNSDLLDALFRRNQFALGTPLRSGLNAVGTYLQQSTDQPDRPAPIQHSCQQNFSVLFTDGFWNGGNPLLTTDVDGDGVTASLADYARHYYDIDLRPDLDNRVPVSGVDSLSSQHLSTFGVAFGVRGNLDDSDGDGWPELAGNAPTIDGVWGNPFVDDAAKIDDLWHAAFNSKGLFAAASSPQDITAGLVAALAEVERRTGSAASVAANSGRVSTDAYLYQARFNSESWTGDLWALPLAGQGALNQSQSVSFEGTRWTARSFFDSSAFDPDTRVVLTADQATAGGAVTGRPFRHTTAAGLSERYRAKLDAGMAPLGASGDAATFRAALTDWLRGEPAASFSSYAFRQRNSVLGDLVHSDPVYVGPPQAFGSLYATDSYTAFKTTHADRSPMIYVGGNDGMLHAFDADTGVEKLAFVPGTLVPDLYQLADPDYSHRYFVDGQITVADICPATASCSWQTLLVAGLGAGGKGLFALDVTRPADFSEANAGSLVLWELSSDEEPALGYTFGRASVAKLNNGQWAVLSGNGYGSQEGKASLLVLDTQTGRPLATGGVLTAGAAGDNGLSSPAAVDLDGNGTVDYVYAGDLKGNLWKFDLRSADASQWGVAFEADSEPVPLFAAGASRPITVMPQVGSHPSRGGRLVYFGTGKYLEAEDSSSVGQADQALYGIWDDDGALQTPLTDADLLTQTIEQELVVHARDTNGDNLLNSQDEGVSYRTSSDNAICWSGCGSNAPHRGWRLVLTYEGNNRGEKQTVDPVLRNGRIVFNSFQPSSEVCEGGGRSWLMELDANDGSFLREPAFDLNGDGKFDFEDSHSAYAGSGSGGTAPGVDEACNAGVCPSPSGVALRGLTQKPAVLDCGTGVECKYLSTSSGSVRRINENPGQSALGRQSWRQLLRDD